MTRPALIPLVCALSLWLGVPALAEPAEWPEPEALYNLLREHLPGVRPPASDETNAVSYLESLAPLVLIGRASDSEQATSPLVRTNVHGEGIGYLRIGQIVPDLPASLSNALVALGHSNAASRVVVDLRYATGWDFEAALAAASLFAREPLEGFRLGDKALSVSAAGTSTSRAVMILINHSTRGAAELLAAALREVVSPSLLIGTNTAGLAASYLEVPVPNAGVIRVRKDVVTLPGDRPFPADGLAPDLVVPVAEADEALYFADPYRRVVDGHALPPNIVARLNEAELVRRRRGLRVTAEPTPPPRYVHDPVLARALDLLDGLGDLSDKASMGDSR